MNGPLIDEVIKSATNPAAGVQHYLVIMWVVVILLMVICAVRIHRAARKDSGTVFIKMTPAQVRAKYLEESPGFWDDYEGAPSTYRDRAIDSPVTYLTGFLLALALFLTLVADTPTFSQKEATNAVGEAFGVTLPTVDTDWKMPLKSGALSQPVLVDVVGVPSICIVATDATRYLISCEGQSNWNYLLPVNQLPVINQ